MGFSFIYEILPLANSWQITRLGFLKNHLFYSALKGQTINLDRFAGAIDLLGNESLEEIMSNIPLRWQNNNISKITNHVREIKNHVNEFIDEIRRILQ